MILTYTFFLHQFRNDVNPTSPGISTSKSNIRRDPRIDQLLKNYDDNIVIVSFLTDLLLINLSIKINITPKKYTEPNNYKSHRCILPAY